MSSHRASCARGIVAFARWLSRRPRETKGQIATFALLGITGVLVMALMAANLGQVTAQTTTVTNAADAAALRLGSDISTMSHAMWVALGRHTKKCKFGGWLGMVIILIILIIIIILVAIVCPPCLGLLASIATTVGAAVGAAVGVALAGTIVGTLAASVVAGLALGAVGAALGAGMYAIGGGSIGEGALLGFQMGYMLGSLAGGMYAAPYAAAGAGSAASAGGGAAGGGAAGAPGLSTAAPSQAGGFTAALGRVAEGVGNFLRGAWDTVKGAVAWVGEKTGFTGAVLPEGATVVDVAAAQALLGGIALSPLAGAAMIYNKASAEYAAFSRITGFINSLPDRERIRETALLEGLQRAVEDPNTVADHDDADGNCTCTDEERKAAEKKGRQCIEVPEPDCTTGQQISAFQAWFFRREKILADEMPKLEALVEAFLRGPLAEFEATIPELLAMLDRLELNGADGALVEVLRALKQAGYPQVDFWSQLQPSPSAIDTYLSTDPCPGVEEVGVPCNSTVTRPPGMDELDQLVVELHGVEEYIQGLWRCDQYQNPTPTCPIPELTRHWEPWLWVFYDPDPSDPDPSEEGRMPSLKDVIVGDGTDADFRGVRHWSERIRALRDLLPACAFDDPISPTRVTGNVPCRDFRPGSTFATIDEDLDDEFAIVLSQLDRLMADVEAITQAARELDDQLRNGLSKLALDGGLNPVTYPWKDSHGEHRVEMEVSNFLLPKVKTKKKAFKTCQVLTRYSDGDGSNTWVRIKRTEPSNQPAGGHWIWNPVSSGIEKQACAGYSFDRIGLARTRGCAR